MKWLRALFFIGMSFIGFIFLAGLAILTWPEILLNSTTFNLAARLLANRGIEIRWKNLKFHTEAKSLFEREFFFDFQGLSVNVEKSGVFGITPQASLSFAVNFSGFKPRLSELGPISVWDLHWILNSEKPQSHQNPTTGRLTLTGSQSERNKIQFNLRGDARLPDSSQADVNSTLELNRNFLDEEIHLEYTAQGQYRKGQKSVSLVLQGVFVPEHLVVRFSGKLHQMNPAIPMVRMINCELELRQRPGVVEPYGKSNEAVLTCPLETVLPLSAELAKQFEVPEDLGAFLRADFQMESLIPDFNSPLVGRVEVTLNPLRTSYLQATANISAQIEGIPSHPMEEWNIQLQPQMVIQMTRFEKCVALMEKTDWQVPAPFHVLHGRVAMEAHGDSSLKVGRFPFSFFSVLSSQLQKVNLSAEGTFDLNEGWVVDLNLADVRLELPKLDLASPPKFFPDPRLKRVSSSSASSSASSSSASSASGRAKTKSSLPFKIHVHTSEGSPIHLLSNLTPDPIPIDLDFYLENDQPIRGKVKIAQFNVEFFRRKATLTRFNLDFREPFSASPVSGSVRIDYTDYIVYVDISNSVGRPIVSLRSEPSLPQDQLVAVLLFGHPLDELDPNQDESVGNTQAAFADGAVNLLSLYVLASTPIESVGYDPTAGVVTAKLRLADGTSLNLGKGADTTSIGIRKRLGGSWTIVTDWTQSTDLGNVASAYLEWARRY